jgi:hypothetical protein
MWLPLYEEIEAFMYWLNSPPEGFEQLMVYFISLMYVGFWVIIVKYLIYKPIKYLKKNNRKEDFWEQYKEK